ASGGAADALEVASPQREADRAKLEPLVRARGELQGDEPRRIVCSPCRFPRVARVLNPAVAQVLVTHRVDARRLGRLNLRLRRLHELREVVLAETLDVGVGVGPGRRN